MGDLPDWTQAISNPGTVVFSGPIASPGSEQLDVLGSTSVVVTIDGTVVNTDVSVIALWGLAASPGVVVDQQFYTGVPIPSALTEIRYESPIYGDTLIFNNDGPQPVNLIVIASSRQVNQPRLLNATTPGRRYTAAGPFTSGTPVQFTGADGGLSSFSSNAQSTFSVDVPVAGVLQLNYIDQGGNPRVQNIAALSATAHNEFTFALPQAVVSFAFAPSANGAGTATMLVAAAQL